MSFSTTRIGAIMKPVLACAAAVASSSWLLAQQPPASPPTFSAATDVVRLEVSVLGRDRRPVRGLTAADFTVLEDGRERPIAAFSAVELPSVPLTKPAAAWVRDAPRDVVTNTGSEEGRLVVIAFDWSIRSYDQALARRIAHAAIDGLGPADQAAVVFTDPASNAGVPQNFTSDRALLRAAIDQPFATALIDILPTTGNEWKLDDPERYDSGGCHCGRCALDTLTRVAGVLRDISQRPKVLLFIGTYVRTYEAPMGQKLAPPIPGRITLGAALQPSVCNAPLSDARGRMERAMAEANATIHVLDPVGFETPANTPLGVAARIRERQDSLPVIADLTGGRTVMSTNAPETHVPAILEESGSYYLLGFTPSSPTHDGRSHRINVRVRQADVTVKARDRYTRSESAISALDSTDADLMRTLGGVLPQSSVPFQASVVPLVGGESGAAALVVGRIDVTGLAPSPSLKVVSAAFTPRGRAVASKRVDLRSVGESARETGALGLVSGLSLEPGLHEVRIAAELPSGLIGSVNAFVDVPDFRRAPLSLSGALVHVDPEELTEPREELQVLPFVPTARRSFARTETVSVFVQISQGTTRTDALQSVALRVRIVDAREATNRDQTQTLGPDQFSTNRTANSRLALPVQSLPAGEYLLQIEASIGDRAVARAVRFEVR